MSNLIYIGECIMAVNGRAKDLTGQTFGYWSVLSRDEEKSKHGHRYYLCRCVCGKEKVLRGSMLTSGNSISCRCITYIDKNKTHGMSNTKTYQTWVSMRERCKNPKAAHYDVYGAVGISVCKEWDSSFESFFKDMGERPRNTTIDRIDNSKGYFKENCRWATPKEQTLNRGVTKWVTAFGDTLCFNDMCKKHGLTTTMVRNRLKKGMSLEDALTIKHKKLMYEISLNGEVLGLMDFSKKYGVALTTLYRKLSSGMDYVDAISNCLKSKGIEIKSGELLVATKPYKFKKP